MKFLQLGLNTLNLNSNNNNNNNLVQNLSQTELPFFEMKILDQNLVPKVAPNIGLVDATNSNTGKKINLG